MIKYLIMDVDGSLTDGKIYIGPTGETMKAFSVKDGYVINYILKPKGITPIIITARNSSIVQHRCDELGINEVYQGKIDKFSTLIEIVGEDNLEYCAYFGDDILDIKCMEPIKKAGGVVGCPADAVKKVKNLSDFVCLNKAGEGALREFVEWLVQSKEEDRNLNQRIEEALDYLKKVNIEGQNIGKRIDVNDDFFYSIQSYKTKSSKECRLESHRKYVDIQMMIKGEELIDLADIASLNLQEDYDDTKDIMFWEIPQRMARVKIKSGDYIILYPENAHRGAACEKESLDILKIVGKVRIK